MIKCFAKYFAQNQYLSRDIFNQPPKIDHLSINCNTSSYNIGLFNRTPIWDFHCISFVATCCGLRRYSKAFLGWYGLLATSWCMAVPEMNTRKPAESVVKTL